MAIVHLTVSDLHPEGAFAQEVSMPHASTYDRICKALCSFQLNRSNTSYNLRCMLLPCLEVLAGAGAGAGRRSWVAYPKVCL